jgi:hypothetical protein
LTGYIYSVALMIPAGLRDEANRLACAIGHDEMPGHTFAVPVSSDGQEPASHYACHTWAQQSFVDLLASAGAGVLPEIEWGEYDLTVDDVAAVLTALVVSAPQATMLDCDAWLAGRGVQRVR